LEAKQIKLSEDARDIREIIKKSDIVPKDLNGFLEEILKKETGLAQKVINAFNAYR